MLAAADLHVFKTPTPLLHNAWSSLLTQLHILDDFSDIPMGLKNGFKTGITSTITSTYIPDNHASALRNPQVIINHIQLELSLGRYSGPYFPFQLQKLIGHFRTAPLGVVPKSQTDKFRIIQDLSFPRDDLFLKSPTLRSIRKTFLVNGVAFRSASSLLLTLLPRQKRLSLTLMQLTAIFLSIPMTNVITA